jgi:CheY-like chemotaxis protein
MTVRRALVVDDSRLARQSLVRLLTKLDLEAVSVASGKEAVKPIKRGAADVVFVDYFMPEMDGYATAKAIAQDGKVKHLPLALCTSLESDRKELQQLRDSGLFWGYVPKPPGRREPRRGTLAHQRATRPAARNRGSRAEHGVGPNDRPRRAAGSDPNIARHPIAGPSGSQEKGCRRGSTRPGTARLDARPTGKTVRRTIRRDPNNPQGVFASRLSHDDEVTR